MITVDGYKVTPTIFPDQTSQVWRLPEQVFSAEKNVVVWDFESEAELMHLAQLKELLSLHGNRSRDFILQIRYLPYGRQDKFVSNDSTFALRAFAKQLNALHFTKVEIFDPHSSVAIEEIRNSKAIDPLPQIAKALVDTAGVTCFPDAGAAVRYGSAIGQLGKIVFAKVRDQQTGEILGLSTEDSIRPTSYLIIDDICDGGKTFIEVSKALYAGGATEVHLYVSHGLFTKGKQVLRDAGIKRIFTKNGEEE
jgi:ribose-phosphate pyrophosphokinase